MSPEPRKSSPWPIFVALGIASTEAGVLFGLVPIAVGGVLLFGVSAAGILREVGYAATLWRPLRVIGGVIGAASLLTLLVVTPTIEPDALIGAVATDGIAVRAAVVLGSAALLITVGYAGPTVSRWQ